MGLRFTVPLLLCVFCALELTCWASAPVLVAAMEKMESKVEASSLVVIEIENWVTYSRNMTSSLKYLFLRLYQRLKMLVSEKPPVREPVKS